jgi:hypothetical protein
MIVSFVNALRYNTKRRHIALHYVSGATRNVTSRCTTHFFVDVFFFADAAAVFAAFAVCFSARRCSAATRFAAAACERVRV